jgi:hypothetical protein
MSEPANATPDQEQLVSQQAQLALYRRRLAYNIQQQAQLGVIAPFALLEDIRTARIEIRRYKEFLRAAGMVVDDLPDDEQTQPSAMLAYAPAQAGAGLTAMADLLGAPDAQAAVAGFRNSFEIVCRQIDRLSHYKDLHDLLHDLQFNCYNPIVRGAKDFPNNLLFLESLADYAAELQQILNSLWEVLERAAFPTNEQAWIQQLDQASGLLREAIERADKQLLDRATFQIDRVLYLHPTKINERLKEAARDLQLASLIKAMDAVQRSSATAGPAPEKLEQLGRGITAIEQLDQGLARLIEEHDTWQEIDLELHRVDEDLDRQTQALEWLWPDLKVRLEPLCTGRVDRWTQDLRQTIERIERALAAQDAAAITAVFRALRRQVALCFFQADKMLKELCRTLRQVDGPLNSVMSIIA